MTDHPRRRWHELLRENLEVGVEEDGHHFVWLATLGLYGAGATFEEARRHLLRQFEEAIDERLEIGDAPGEGTSFDEGDFEAQTLEQTVEVLRKVVMERNRLRNALRLVRDLCDRSGDDCHATLATVRAVAEKAIR
jgi:hypothetical protein